MDFKLNLNTETVDHAHPTEPLCFEPRASIHDVLVEMKKHRAGKVLICRDGVLVGLFTERDALKLMVGGCDLAKPIESVMISNPVAVKADETVGHAISQMSSGGYRRLPIVDEAGKPQGVLSVTGILHYLVEHFPMFVYTLPPSPQHITQEREGA